MRPELIPIYLYFVIFVGFCYKSSPPARIAGADRIRCSKGQSDRRPFNICVHTFLYVCIHIHPSIHPSIAYIIHTYIHTYVQAHVTKRQWDRRPFKVAGGHACAQWRARRFVTNVNICTVHMSMHVYEHTFNVCIYTHAYTLTHTYCLYIQLHRGWNHVWARPAPGFDDAWYVPSRKTEKKPCILSSSVKGCVRACGACVRKFPTYTRRHAHNSQTSHKHTHHSQACTSWRGSVRTLPHTTAAESRHMQSYIHSYVRMYVFMCVCVCMYVFMYLCIYVCMFKCMHACMFICSYVCIDRISISIYLSIYVIYICIPVAQVSQWLLRLYISGWGCARNDSAGRRPQGVCVCVF